MKEATIQNITVVMPAYNAEAVLEETITAVRSVPDVTSIIVVDDGSMDSTAEIAQNAGVRLISHSENRGKGAALQTGVDKAVEMGADVIVLLDSDLGSCVTEISRLIQPVKAGDAEMTIARFMGSGGGGFGIVKRIAQYILYSFTHQRFESPLSGQRVITADVARNTRFRSGWGVEIGLTVDAHRAGYRIMEIPVQMSQKGTGKNLRGFLHRGKQLAGILRTTLALLLTRKHA